MTGGETVTTWGVWQTTAVGVTGSRSGWVFRDGKPATFKTEREARAAADELTEQAEGYVYYSARSLPSDAS